MAEGAARYTDPSDWHKGTDAWYDAIAFQAGADVIEGEVFLDYTDPSKWVKGGDAWLQATAYRAALKAAKGKGIQVGVSVSGVKSAVNLFAGLNGYMHKALLPNALGASAKRLNDAIVQNIPVGPRGHEGDTGGWRAHQQRMDVESLPRRGDRMGTAVPLPTRAALGVAEDDVVFYPFIVEFGSERITATVAPIRTAVNAKGEREFIQMGKVIGTGLEGLAVAVAGGKMEQAKWWHLIRPPRLDF